MNLEPAKKIHGWMDEHELAWIADTAFQSSCGVIIEIGCWRGRTSRVLSDNVLIGTRIFCIDTWNGSPNEQGTHAPCKEMDGDGVFFEFCQNNFDAIYSGQLIPMRMSSQNAAKLLAEQKVKADFIFIDGCHDYEAVKADIEAFRPLLAHEGVLAGHDYASNWGGVVKAVQEAGFAIELPAGIIWKAKFEKCPHNEACPVPLR